MLFWNFFATLLAAPDIAIPVAVSFVAFFKLTFPVVIFCSTKFDPNEVAASIATFAIILPIPKVVAPSTNSHNKRELNSLTFNCHDYANNLEYCHSKMDSNF